MDSVAFGGLDASNEQADEEGEGFGEEGYA